MSAEDENQSGGLIPPTPTKMPKNYSFDSRTKAEFAKDIKDATAIESKLMKSYVLWLNFNRRAEPSYFFINNGIDNTGKYIADRQKVKAHADFLLCRVGRSPRKIDIKFCRKDYKSFHLKVNQLTKYLKDDVCIVNWMGIETPNRRFCIIRPKEIAKLLKTGRRKRKWSKDVIEIYNTEVEWYEA